MDFSKFVQKIYYGLKIKNIDSQARLIGEIFRAAGSSEDFPVGHTKEQDVSYQGHLFRGSKPLSKPLKLTFPDKINEENFISYFENRIIDESLNNIMEKFGIQSDLPQNKTFLLKSLCRQLQKILTEQNDTTDDIVAEEYLKLLGESNTNTSSGIPKINENEVMDGVFERSIFSSEKLPEGVQKEFMKIMEKLHNYDYILGESFHELQQEILNKGWRGFFLHGKPGTGKSATAMQMARYLVQKEIVYAPVWPKIKYDEIEGLLNEEDKENDDCIAKITKYIKTKIKEQFESCKYNPDPEEELKKEKYFFIIDDHKLDNDKIKYILMAFKEIFFEYNSKPYLIITSNSPFEDELLLDNPKLGQRKVTGLDLRQVEVFIRRYTDNKGYAWKIKDAEKDNTLNSLIEVLFKILGNNLGLIITALKHLNKETMTVPQLEKYLKDDKDNEVKETLRNKIKEMGIPNNEYLGITREIIKTTGKTKAVVFDFDGTLTKPNLLATWEYIWLSLGYDLKECRKLHRMYDNEDITYVEWCKLIEKCFIDKKLNKSILYGIIEKINLIDGCKEAFEKLSKRKIKIYILSGSIIFIIEEVLKDIRNYVAEIKANDFRFSPEGFLTEIIATKYDFSGKPIFITEIAEKMKISTKDILFVGNCYNDKFAYRSGARTLLINPKMADPSNFEEWNHCIQDCDNLGQILDFV